jgi:hypothetical protein
MARYRLGVPVHGLFCSAGGPLLEVLEYLGILSVLFAVIFYYSEAADRKKQKYYQAWQVIDTAQAKGGSGGRIEALQELTADGVPLVGVDVSEAFLEGVQLPGAKLARTDLEAADLRNSMLEGSDLKYAALKSPSKRLILQMCTEFGVLPRASSHGPFGTVPPWFAAMMSKSPTRYIEKNLNAKGLYLEKCFRRA